MTGTGCIRAAVSPPDLMNRETQLDGLVLDVLTADPAFGARSLAATRARLGDGPLIACDVVWAELVAALETPEAVDRALDAIPVSCEPLGRAAVTPAGMAWREYRRAGGPRERVVADLLVGAHAVEHAGRLLTRDRGFHRLAFAGLPIVDPSALGA